MTRDHRRLPLRRRALRAQRAPAQAGYCHCTRCQRRTGTAASAQARIDGRTFRADRGRGRRSRLAPSRRRLREVLLRRVRLAPVQPQPRRPVADEHPHGGVRRGSRGAAELAQLRRLCGAVGADPRRRARALPREAVPRAQARSPVGADGGADGHRARAPALRSRDSERITTATAATMIAPPSDHQPVTASPRITAESTTATAGLT